MADLFDIVVARKLSGGGGGGGTTVEALSVTQNGTYTAPSGKAYSPVSVNVSGGSSDFSAAQVTVRGDSERWFGLFGAVADISREIGSEEPVISIYKLDTNVAGDTYTVALYQGATYGYTDAPIEAIAVSGDVSLAEDGHGGTNFTITGDCTITIS